MFLSASEGFARLLQDFFAEGVPEYILLFNNEKYTS
jgi:hypothetical protein